MKSDTRFMSQLRFMTPSQVVELSSTMTTAGIGYELQGDWREPFRRMSHKYTVGYAHRVYSMLAKMHYSKIEDLVRAITEVEL